MVGTGGEPDVVGDDKRRVVYLFDGQVESAEGRRIVYCDREGQAAQLMGDMLNWIPIGISYDNCTLF